jgi:hypothetical protein
MVFIGIGNRRTPLSDQAKLSISIASGIYILVFVVLVFVNWSYVDSQSDFFIGGFPLPTSIMLYGLTLVPLLFTLLYIIKFEAWILSKEDLEKFEAILRSREQHELD